MEETTEQKILTAAREVFTRKGYAAARMQEIADRAEINKGLLHYYFKSKEKLFRAVFDEAFGRFAHNANRIFETGLPLFEKIEAFVHTYMDILEENPQLPVFVLGELNRNPKAFVESVLARDTRPDALKFLGQIQLAVQSGRIRPVDPFHLLVNMLGLCVFPFMARPMIQGLLEIDADSFDQLMKKRRREVIDFVLHAIRPIPEE